MTGSGSAVFGLFEKGKGEEVAAKLEKRDFEHVYLTELRKTGLEF